MTIRRQLGVPAVLALLALAATGCATSSGNTSAPAPSVSATPATPVTGPITANPSPQPTGRPGRVAAPGSGSRRQTRAHPQARGPAFRALATDLWLAVTQGKPALAKDAFFPVDAYKQVKAIADPAADWKARLWDDFALDVLAVHRLLGPAARKARLVRILVANDQAAWIDPGACFNSIGYWHVAGSRVIYRAGGHERSFGIASLISWRGAWYIVHFGGVVRPAVGLVDAPAAGQGAVGPQGGC